MAKPINMQQLLIAGVILIAVFYVFPSMLEGTSFAVGGDLTAQETEWGKCPASGLSSIALAAKNTVAEPDAALAVTGAVYTEGKTTALATATTLTTADVIINNTVNCKNGETYRVIMGDGPTQYHRYGDATDTGTWKVATKGIMRYDAPMYVVGSGVLRFSNASDPNTATTTVSLGSGQDDGTTSIRISENTADAYFGTPGQQYDVVVCFNFSTANFTSVHLSGAGVTPNVGINTIASGYEMCDGYNAPNDLVDWGYVDIPIQIDTIAGVNPAGGAPFAGAQTNISVMVFDWATWLKDGNIMYGVQNGDTLAAIGATDLTTYAAIEVH